jgi:hypothetical protein
MGAKHLLFHGEKADPLWFHQPKGKAAGFLVWPVNPMMVQRIEESIHSNPIAITEPFFVVVICTPGMYSRIH